MRIAVISERWSDRPDEGLLQFIAQTVQQMARAHPVLVIHEQGSVPSALASARLPLGKTLVTAQLRQTLAGHGAELVFYIPSACATFNALLRGKRLERALPSSAVALISLQHRDYGPLQRAALRWVRPRQLIVLSEASRTYYRSLGFAVASAGAGVDVERFSPVDAEQKRSLRVALGWPLDQRIVLHVGHLSPRRGLAALAEAARLPRTRSVMLASTATSADREVAAQLSGAGVEVRREYVPDVQRLYQAADVYLFPVTHADGSIEFPLSVLEAMACGLRVVAAPFGSLRERFAAGAGFHYLLPEERVADAIAAVELGPCTTRERALPLSWQAVAARLVALGQGTVQ